MKNALRATQQAMITQTWLNRFKATLLTIPISMLLLIVGLLSTGAGHGSAVLMYLFYAPIKMLDGLLTINGIITGPTLHILYAFCADCVRLGRLKHKLFLCVITFHYLAFILIVLSPSVKHREISQNLIIKTVASDPLFFLLCLSPFVIWQIFIIYLARPDYSKPASYRSTV